MTRTGCFRARALTWLKLLCTSWIPVEEFEIFGTKMPFMPSLQLTSQERTRKGTWLAEEHKLYAHIRLAHKEHGLRSNTIKLFTIQTSRYWRDQNIWKQQFEQRFLRLLIATVDQNFNKLRFKLYLQAFLASAKLSTFTMGLWCQTVNAEQNFIRRICG